MATAIPKVSLSSSRDIPFNRLVLSQSNVRRVKSGLSIEELARDIERRGLLQSLNVRPVLDDAGVETGSYEVPAGGRRFRALELLVKQKKLAKTASVPCVVREAGSAILAEEDSLAENVQRVALHPLDQFRAFRDMLEKGMSEEEIAAAFFVAPTVVKQRLRLMTVSDSLLEIYEQDSMRLEQLMAFSISDDHARQEQVWEIVAQSHNREPYVIRRMLTEKTVAFDPSDMARAGAFVSLASDGTLQVERGFVLPEDMPAEPEETDEYGHHPHHRYDEDTAGDGDEDGVGDTTVWRLSLLAYAAMVSGEGTGIPPAKLIVPMIQSFLASDHVFLKRKRAALRKSTS